MDLSITPIGTSLLSLQQAQTGNRPQGFQLLLNAAAKYLGMSTRDLLDQTQAGKSLAEVAQAQGKSVDGLKDALKTALPTNGDSGTKDAILYRIINAHPGAKIHGRHHHNSVQQTAPTGNEQTTGTGSELFTSASTSMNVTV